MTSLGLSAHSASGDMPQRSSVPGRKFSTRMSAVAIRSRASCWPSASRRFRVIDFLLRAITGHHSDRPCGFSRPHWRIGSPAPGGSILITSAPKSA